MESSKMSLSKVSATLKNLVPANDQNKNVEFGFLPAVLEVQETPPSPLGRIIAYLIMLIFSVGLIWAILGEVDIVAVAHGKIIPSSHSKIIQSIEMGKVKAIHVKEGQRVKQGDVLIELDETISTADYANVNQQRMALEIEIERLKCLVKVVSDSKYSCEKKLTDLLQESILQNQVNEYKQNLSSLKSTYQQKQSELLSVIASVEKLEQTLPITEKRMNAANGLYDKKMISEQEYLEVKQSYIENTQNLKSEVNRRRQVEFELSSIESQTAQFSHEFKSRMMQELASKQIQYESLQQEHVKSRQRNEFQILRSPINGVVQQLTVHTIGGVVSPAEVLMVIVPEDDALEVEAYLENKDIGFVTENQTAEIKIDTFPFTKYGVIDGKVISVSNDAVNDEKLGLVFTMRSSMSRSIIDINGVDVTLSPGMSVSVEVKTGKRRIIEYLARPVEVALSGSMSER